MKRLISFDIQSDFAFFRKPETNNTLNVSYNMIHKPSVLGILGAIIGLRGYEEKGKMPEYYNELKDIKIGITPLNHECGNFSKTPIKYSNTIGYANAGSNFLTEELTLIAPKFRIFVLIDESIETQKRLHLNLKSYKSEFIPYLGKNEFTAWWTNFSEYEYEKKTPDEETAPIRVISLFQKKQILKEQTSSDYKSIDLFELNFEEMSEDLFMYFERLPIDFDTSLMQYKLEEMAFTNHKIKNANKLDNLYYLKKDDAYIQLF